jgi:hypothetical protein
LCIQGASGAGAGPEPKGESAQDDGAIGEKQNATTTVIIFEVRKHMNEF